MTTGPDGPEPGSDSEALKQDPTLELPELGSADELLANAESHVTDGLDEDHRRRAHEASVQKLEILNQILTTAAEQAEQDRGLRKEISSRVFWAIVIQVGVADLGMLIFAVEKHWDLATSIVNAWLGATVIQVIAVGLVIAKSLFPAGGINSSLASEALHEAYRIPGGTSKPSSTSSPGV
jgi:hypothetical protein